MADEPTKPTCIGCEHVRVHDWHYFYCRDIGNKSLPEDWTWWFSGATVRVWSYPKPHKYCKLSNVMQNTEESGLVQ